MDWSMGVLMLVGTAAFWVAVLTGIRALLLTAGSTPGRGAGDPSRPAAHGTAADDAPDDGPVEADPARPAPSARIGRQS